MESIIVEIKGAEGGDHSKLIVKDMLAVYQKAALRRRL